MALWNWIDNPEFSLVDLAIRHAPLVLVAFQVAVFLGGVALGAWLW